MAAPTESRIPDLHRATNAHIRVRMEGWRQNTLGKRKLAKEERPCLPSPGEPLLRLARRAIKAQDKLAALGLDRSLGQPNETPIRAKENMNMNLPYHKIT